MINPNAYFFNLSSIFFSISGTRLFKNHSIHHTSGVILISSKSVC